VIPPRPPLSRRTALTGIVTAGLAALGGAGCSVRMPGSRPATTPTPTPTRAPGGLEPDVQLVVELVTAMQRSVALLEATRTRHPKLAARLAPLLDAEQAHLAVLRRAAPKDALSPGGAPTPVVPEPAPRALVTVLERTEALRDECYTSSVRAESGKFARLLAGMGAALSQRLVAFRAAPARTPRVRTQSATGLDSLQDTLAGEHAAVYVFGVLAAQTSESAKPKLWADLDAAYAWHRAARDELVRRITAASGTPVAAAPSYELPNAAATTGQVVGAALLTERRVTDTYGTLVAETAGRLRRWAIRSLDESAVRQLRFRGRPEIFPGTGGLRSQAR
jgi:hypothetical protein